MNTPSLVTALVLLTSSGTLSEVLPPESPIVDSIGAHHYKPSVRCGIVKMFQLNGGRYMPLREGNSWVGDQHIREKHPDAYDFSEISWALEHGDCRWQRENRYKCKSPEITVIYEDSYDDRCTDNYRFGVVTAFK